ncbi:MAG: hemolysin family protein [Polyangiales bacterium]
MSELATALLGAAIFLLLGALMACLEASLMALPEARVRALRDELGPSGDLLERYLADPGRTLSRLLAGRVIAPIAATVVVVPLFIVRGDPWWVLGLVVLAVSFVYGVMVEVAVSIGRSRARRIAPRALAWMRPVALLLAPLAAPMERVGKWVSALLADRDSMEPPPVTEKEIEYVVEAAQSVGAIHPVRARVLQNVFGLKDRVARDIMVPRTRIVALDVGTGLAEAVRRLSDEGHSRVPIYRGKIDEVVGVLIAKDLFRVATARSSTPPGDDAREATVEAVMRRPPLYVTDAQPVLSVLREMQARRMHIAMVVDEFGALVGLVTLEDVLEELVGEIEDEHDDRNPEADFVEVAEGRYLASAAMPIENLERKLEVDFPEEGDYASLGGFLAARAGKVPEVGTVVVWEGLRFIVREGDKRKATRVEIVRDAALAATG